MANRQNIEFRGRFPEPQAITNSHLCSCLQICKSVLLHVALMSIYKSAVLKCSLRLSSLQVCAEKNAPYGDKAKLGARKTSHRPQSCQRLRSPSNHCLSESLKVEFKWWVGRTQNCNPSEDIFGRILGVLAKIAASQKTWECSTVVAQCIICTPWEHACVFAENTGISVINEDTRKREILMEPHLCNYARPVIS